MLLEFGDNFSAACESTARVWCERDNRAAGHCPVAIVVMDVIHLQRLRSSALWWQIQIQECSRYGPWCQLH